MKQVKHINKLKHKENTLLSVIQSKVVETVLASGIKNADVLYNATLIQEVLGDEDGVAVEYECRQNVYKVYIICKEIKEALETGRGNAVRTSVTMTEQTYYEAQRLKDGTVLRISTNQKSALSLMVGMFGPVIIIAFLAFALSAILARYMAKRIVEPLNELDLEQPLKMFERMRPNFKEEKPLFS